MTTASTSRPTWPRRALRAWLPRALAFAALLWVVTEGDASGWPVLLPVAALVAAVDAAASQWRPWRFRLRETVRFAAYFAARSAQAGVDVAVRALHPRLPIAPGMQTYRLHLADPGSRVLFANVVSLLPGTMTVELDGDRLSLHVLDTGTPVEPALRELERRIAALRGVELAAPGGGS